MDLAVRAVASPGGRPLATSAVAGKSLESALGMNKENAITSTQIDTRKVDGLLREGDLLPHAVRAASAAVHHIHSKPIC